MASKGKKLLLWQSLKMKLDDKYKDNDNIRKYHTPRGAIYTCHYGENIGHEKSGQGRPVLVVSSDNINKYSGNIIVAPLSKNIKWVDNNKKRELKYETHYVLYKDKYSQLKYDSAVQCEDLRSISKARLGSHICIIDKVDMKQIKKRLRSVFQI